MLKLHFHPSGLPRKTLFTEIGMMLEMRRCCVHNFVEVDFTILLFLCVTYSYKHVNEKWPALNAFLLSWHIRNSWCSTDTVFSGQTKNTCKKKKIETVSSDSPVGGAIASVLNECGTLALLPSNAYLINADTKSYHHLHVIINLDN